MTNQIAGLKLPKLLRVVRVRWRFFLATAIGLLAFWLMPNSGFLISRMLIGWDIGVLVYIALGIWMAASTDAKHIRQRSVLFDEGRVAIPLLSVCAAVASLGAIFVLLRMAPVNDRFLTLAFAALTIFLSWSFIQFMFAFHYAHEFYAEHRNGGGGLAFPGQQSSGLLGLPVLFICRRNDITGVGCLRNIQVTQKNRRCAWPAFI